MNTTVPNSVENPTTITAEPGLPYVEILREFDAPVAQVFRAHVDPELIVQWLGPRDVTMRLERWDVQTGGGYRYVHSRAEDDFGFTGVFHRVRTNEMIIQTFEYDGAPDQVALETATFTDLGDGRTRLTGRSVFLSIETRDAMVASGMEHGIRDSMARLDELLTN